MWSLSCITVSVESLGLLRAGLATSRALFPPGGFSVGKNGVAGALDHHNGSGHFFQLGNCVELRAHEKAKAREKPI